MNERRFFWMLVVLAAALAAIPFGLLAAGRLDGDDEPSVTDDGVPEVNHKILDEDDHGVYAYNVTTPDGTSLLCLIYSHNNAEEGGIWCTEKGES